MALNETLPGLALPNVQGGTLDPKMTKPPHALQASFLTASSQHLAMGKSFFHFSVLFCFPASLTRTADIFFYKHRKGACPGTGDTSQDTHPC